MTTVAPAQVRAVIEPPLLAAGFDVEDVAVRQAGRRQLVHVIVDKDGGVSLDDVADASRAAAAALDAVDVIPGAYVLEVSSPGTDRPLTQPRHWRRNRGRLVEVRLRDGTVLTGRIVDADDDTATVGADGSGRAVAFADVTRAQVQLEWNRREGGEDA